MISQVYKNWESSFAILSEIFRNMGMAVVAVFVITLVMLSDLRLCLMVLTSIILTLVSRLLENTFLSFLMRSKGLVKQPTLECVFRTSNAAQINHQ